MGRVKPFLWGAAMIVVLFLTSSDIATDPFGGWTPYFMNRSELERSVFYADTPAEMTNPGKIWTTPNNIYVVERYKGVHVIDNTDPENPVTTGFIVAPGCMDVAIKGGLMYLDNAVDLVAFDLAAGSVTTRLKNYFPEPVSPTGHTYYDNSSEMILVGWKRTKTQSERP
jgi:hypothetical protein